VLLALSINHVWIYFEPLCRFSLNLVGKWCHSRGPWCNNFYSHSSNYFKTATVKISNEIEIQLQ
jgi:hypothetical protein